LECSEDSLINHFSQFGKVKSCAIPKDHKTGRIKGYAFINYFSEKDARCAQESCNDRNFMNKLLIVTFAHEKRVSRSRSRSVSNSPQSESDIKSEIHGLKKTRDELQKKNDELYQDCEKIKKDLRGLNDQKKDLKTELGHYRSKKNIFLPCGHSKFIDLQENSILEELMIHANQHLSAKEAENSNIHKQLRGKIIGILANKFPETYKCNEAVSFIIGKCGHRFVTECHALNGYKKGERNPECLKPIEKLLPCGHTQLIECCREMEIVVCKRC